MTLSTTVPSLVAYQTCLLLVTFRFPRRIHLEIETGLHVLAKRIITVTRPRPESRLGFLSNELLTVAPMAAPSFVLLSVSADITPHPSCLCCTGLVQNTTAYDTLKRST